MNGSPEQTLATGPEGHGPTQSPAAGHGPAGTPHAGPAAGSQRESWPPAPKDSRRKSVALACCLSALPGLGQVYVGYYQRGFMHILVFAGIVTLLAADVGPLGPLLGIFLPFFVIYNIIDAGRRAAWYNEALAGMEKIELPGDIELPGSGGSLAGGLALIVVGFVLLLNTRFGLSLEFLEEWWPVFPMLLGFYLLGRWFVESREAR